MIRIRNRIRTVIQNLWNRIRNTGNKTSQVKFNPEFRGPHLLKAKIGPKIRIQCVGTVQNTYLNFQTP